MFEIFNYGFIIRGLEAGIVAALICPLIGIFLVLRRYSLIADTLAHISLAGVALGLVLKINPLLTALVVSTISSIFIDRLRLTKKVYGESALAIFLSGSLALALILISAAKGFNVNLFNYLFGSLVTVKQADVWLVMILGIVVLGMVIAFFKELVFISFDEEAAQVSGIPVKALNTLFIIVAAITVTAMIPVVGILLVSSLIVIPSVTALQLKLSFIKTLIWAEVFSFISVIAGIFSSFYLNLSAGGSIVFASLIIFVLVLVFRSLNSK